MNRSADPFPDEEPEQKPAVEHDSRYIVGLRAIATPIPVAFSGLLIASVVLSGYELGWVPNSQRHATGWVLLAVPIPLQLLAAWWGFAARSAAAATGSAILASVWIALALDLIAGAAAPPGLSEAAGLLMYGAGAALLVPVLGELTVGSLLAALVLTTTVIRFFLTATAAIRHSSSWSHASGWMGCVVALCALYAALALELEDMTQRAILPTLRRGPAKRSFEQPVEQQVAELAHQAGVRRVL